LTPSQQKPTSEKNESEVPVEPIHNGATPKGRMGGWFAYADETGAPNYPPVEAQPRTLHGTVGLVVDDCIEFPLWDRRGPIEESDEWLHEHLGISYDLIGDLHRLLDDYYSGVHSNERETALSERLQAELEPHLRATRNQQTARAGYISPGRAEAQPGPGESYLLGSRKRVPVPPPVQSFLNVPPRRAAGHRPMS
jgi:hypothetical protein